MFSGQILKGALDLLQIHDSADPSVEVSTPVTTELDPVLTEIKAIKFPAIKNREVRSDLRTLLFEYSGLSEGWG